MTKLKTIKVKIELTGIQVWFLKCAIEAKDAVLPFQAINDTYCMIKRLINK